MKEADMADNDQDKKHEPGVVKDVPSSENTITELNEEELKDVSGGLTNATISR
jgi:bacteriocin-like protein